MCRRGLRRGTEAAHEDRATAEHVFGGERIIFYFMSEDRVDFRELVRTLAAEFQTRIEMRQVGARDEARLLADYETCGRRVLLQELPQDAQAGRHADGQAAEGHARPVEGERAVRAAEVLPALRARDVRGAGQEAAADEQPDPDAQGIGQIVDRQVLTQLVKIRKDDGGFLVVPVEEILETGLPPAPRPDPKRLPETAGTDVDATPVRTPAGAASEARAAETG